MKKKTDISKARETDISEARETNIGKAKSLSVQYRIDKKGMYVFTVHLAVKCL